MANSEWGGKAGFPRSLLAIRYSPLRGEPFRPRVHPWYYWADLEQGGDRMSSESVGGIFGAIVAAIVLAVAVVFGPIGQYGKPARPAKVEQAPAAAPAAPAPPRGPVIREVPNQ
ncbi:hypothetical protein ABIB73_003532 [Bradyrhizobium sp. F1.4.3]